MVAKGKTSSQELGNNFGVSIEEANKIAKQLVDLGSFIELKTDIFEAMHPRFTAVNMYRKMCERENLEFKRNVIVDNIGVALEKTYEDARTK